MYNNHLLTAVHEYSVEEAGVLFLKPNVKKNREFYFSLFVLFDLLLTASNFMFD